jgi:putative transposase
MRFHDGRIRKLCKRFNEPGDAHELTFSCHHKLPLLAKDRTREWFIKALTMARKRHDLGIWAYVIMPDHAHVLIYPRRKVYSISAILKTIKQSVARRAIDYLREHSPDWLTKLEVRWPSGRCEHRFWQQGGGYDRNIVKLDTV